MSIKFTYWAGKDNITYSTNDVNTNGIFSLFVTGDRIHLPSKNYSWNEASIFSKSVLGDTPTTREVWYLKPSNKNYILLQFKSFDIGCQTKSILEIETSTADKRTLCNRDRTEILDGLITDGQTMKITFTFQRTVSYLIEGFGARYINLEHQNFDSGLVSEETYGTY